MEVARVRVQYYYNYTVSPDAVGTLGFPLSTTCRSRAATELHNRPIDEAEMVTSSDGVWCAHERRVKEALAHKLNKFSSFTSDCRVLSPTERRTR